MSRPSRTFDEQVYRDSDGCWIWMGRRSPDGYGKYRPAGTTDEHRAHRYAYELWVGPIPEGLLVCHSCDVPLCVNPAHLWTGTPLDNAQDRTAKGRGRNGRVKGSPPTWRKLSDEQVAEVRVLLDSTELTRAEIGARFGVSAPLIQKIAHGYRSHV